MCFILLKFYIEGTCLVFLYLCSFLGFKHTLLGQIRATYVFFFQPEKLAVWGQLMIILLACELVQQPQAPKVGGVLISKNILLFAKKIFKNQN